MILFQNSNSKLFELKTWIVLYVCQFLRSVFIQGVVWRRPAIPKKPQKPWRYNRQGQPKSTSITVDGLTIKISRAFSRIE